jgi:hypothetical protein
MTGAWRRAQRRRSSARVIRVVATDRTIVAARIAAMAHGGKCAGTAATGGSGGTGVKEGIGGAVVAHAAGARPMAAARQTASPPGPASVLGMRGGCAGAGWWLIEGSFGCQGGRFPDGLMCCPHGHCSVWRPKLPWDWLGQRLGTGLVLVVK